MYEPGTPILDMLTEVGSTPSAVSPLLDADPDVVTVFECVGRAPIVRSIIAEAPPHAHVVLAGACPHSIELETCLPRYHSVVTAALERLGDLFGRLATSERTLAETSAAFDALAHEPGEIKILIRPGA